MIEVGTHRELVEKGGRYAELWEHQQQEEKGEIESEKLWYLLILWPVI